ncbi:hypothetical protein CORC01_08596 [Colletotrichum orchidophilum]|uniref:Uncharacterized protein n=1 Tax=Colletotrichum orchidophilum TaxID=1209926 RepID=A0A1G4B3R2_9PEZI|nr:uncharacterized protein CORC01_08596 [Colletotrichum orchidophilum]OHE96059.1 hypothetical protein CORC01_08596 [Colletotrichum orchidophilum]
MSFRSDMVETGSDAGGPPHGRADLSSHDHSIARRMNNYSAVSWLTEAFLQAQNRSARIAAGSPRSGVGILGLGLLEHHINLLPTMRHAEAVPMFDHLAGSAKYLGWRQKVATWPLSQQEAMNNRSFAV